MWPIDLAVENDFSRGASRRLLRRRRRIAATPVKNNTVHVSSAPPPPPDIAGGFTKTLTDAGVDWLVPALLQVRV